MSPYYQESVRLGTEFQKNNKNWAGYDVVKYQKKIKHLVDRYSAKTILDYGCGKGLQYKEKLPYGQLPGELIPTDDWKTFDEYLGVTVYPYDPCVEEYNQLPDPKIKFDGVICTQVLNSIPDDDMPWVRDLLQQHSAKFCFIGVNFQREAKSKKPCMILSILDCHALENSSVAITTIGPAAICSGGGRIALTMQAGRMINWQVHGRMCLIGWKASISI